jgi:hypothetical protein|tara:strand:+ start:2295 stop:2447 length:153 start_codon:yes stop_codon:yes gene_type:complete
MIFKELYWKSLSDKELRKTISSNLLESYKKDAKKEMIRRTTNYRINDIQG